MGKSPDALLAFTRGRIFTPEMEIVEGTLVTSGSEIRSIGKSSETEVPSGAEVVDCSGKILAPGFVDLHLHGGGGNDFSNQEGLVATARFHASCGTTSMVPTLGPDRIPGLKHQLSLLGQGYPKASEGPLPEILGLYLEGPFLSPGQGGAFDVDVLALPQEGLIDELAEASNRTLRMMALAPELPGGTELVREVRDKGIIPCLGHTNASYDQALLAISEGVRHTTHLFNAMSGFHHREPGAAMAALLHPDVSVEVIVDGHHLHPATVQMVYRIKGAERMILVSDAVPLSGSKGGSFRFGGQEVEIRDGAAVNQEGHLAGSLLTLAEAVRMAVEWAGIPLMQALRMATLNPACLVQVENRKGRLFEGGDADLVVLSESLEIEAVYIGGRHVRMSGSTVC